jgi:glycosyltransferase involved in cell wall biosynthesis
MRRRDRRIDRGSEQLKLVFVGNMNYPPNRDAVVWFARQVIPIIEESVSDVAFDVIGPNAAPDLISELRGRVTFRGFIDDLRDALGHYDVSVAPIRFGGGTKLKVLEALSTGSLS